MKTEKFTFGKGQVYFAKAKPRSWIDRLMRRSRQYEPYKLYGEASNFTLDIETGPPPRKTMIERAVDFLRAWWAR